MPSITVTVGSSIGLHARPAATIADAVTRLDHAVTLAMPGADPVDAGSALMIMTLGASMGDSVVVSSEDQAAAQVIADLVAADLDA
jgi:phosphocarrier protein HPr